MRRWIVTSTVAVALICATSVAHADDPDPNQATKDETARISADKDRLQALADRATAQGNLTKAQAGQVSALGLPTFEGKTTLEGDKAGAMEVDLLATAALGAGAASISGHVDNKTILLAGDEVLDLGAADGVQYQIDYIKQLYQRAHVIKPADAGGDRGGGEKGGNPALVIAAVSALAGLFRSETTISGVDATSPSDKTLALSVAAKASSKPIMPSARIAGLTDAGKALYLALNDLNELRDIADTMAAALPAADKATEAQKKSAQALSTATTRHDAFLAKVLTPDDKGSIPFAVAARTVGLVTDQTAVVRVYMIKAGGSIVNSKNIATTFGLDPLKLSGAVVVAYVKTNPISGAVIAADLMSCDTDLVSVRSVQDRTWKNRRGYKNKGTALCTSVL